jgi:peptidoglycan/LPS O-acetylase OafA/YrhL
MRPPGRRSIFDMLLSHAIPRRPDWLPPYLKELDGLRGLAVLGVFLFHARVRLLGSWLYFPASAGWSGVSLFFVLSGFLITSILLNAREQSLYHYYRDFYARRALRILPVYFLLIAVCFAGPKWLLGLGLVGFPKWKMLVAMLLFSQNLFHAQLLGGLEPTWSLAIEEQYYFAWAPIIKLVRHISLLIAGLVGVIVLSPILRLEWVGYFNSTNTLFHLDCIAYGSLLAVGIMTFGWKRQTWLWTGAAFTVGGFAALYAAHGAAFQDSALGLGLAGLVLVAIVGSGTHMPLTYFLRHGPLPFYGRISYGFYLIHIPVIMGLGLFYSFIDRRTGGNVLWANLLVVLVQLTISTMIALFMWHRLEKPILRLKRYFTNEAKEEKAAVCIAL